MLVRAGVCLQMESGVSVNSSISMFMLVLSCAMPLSLSVKLKAVQRVN